MDAAESKDVQRLRRELRALSAVNRQMHAQLESLKLRSVRRLTPGSEWLEQLQLIRGGDPTIVRAPTRGTFVVEGNTRREVKAGILVAALTKVLGPARDIRDRDLDRWPEGPPVEVMESGSGPAFLVVGGRRLPLRGLPLSFFVTTDEMLLFPEGEELRIASTSRALTPGRASRARAVLRREGPARGALELLRRASRRLRGTRTRPRDPA